MKNKSKLSSCLYGFIVFIQTMIASETFATPDIFQQGRDYDAESNLLICVREILANREGGLDGINTAGAILTVFGRLDRSATVYEFSTWWLKGVCDAYRDENKSIKGHDDHEEMLTYLESMNYSDRVYNTITDYLFPMIRCTSLGASLHEAIAAGVGAGLSIGYCLASDGEQWLEGGFDLIGTFGGGSFGLLELRRAEREDFSHRSIFDFSVSPRVTVGAFLTGGIAMGLGSVDLRGLIVGGDLNGKRKTAIETLDRLKMKPAGGGIGVGEGVVIGSGVTTHIQLVSLGSHRKAMVELWEAREANNR